jgi:seryl-tRNA(Sec) selenium transferase
VSIAQQMFGFKRIINASGTMTLLWGSLMSPEVLHARDEAAQYWARLDDL